MLRFALLLPAVLVSVMADPNPHVPDAPYCQGIKPGDEGQGLGAGVWLRGKATDEQISRPEQLCYDGFDEGHRWTGPCESMWGNVGAGTWG